MRNYNNSAFFANFDNKNGGITRDRRLPTSKLFFHIPSEFARSALVYASYVGQTFGDDTYIVRRNRFDYYLLAVVDSGALYFQYDGDRFEVHAGEVLLIDCRKPHVYGAIGHVSFRYIYFRGGSCEEYYRLLSGTEAYFHRPVCSVEMQSAMQSVFALVTDEMYDEHRISVQLYRILSELSRQDGRGESLQNAAVLQAITYMEHHFFEKLTIAQIADHVNLSEYYFSRLFRRCTSVSPHEYVVNLRITMARQLLAGTQKSVECIAEECGFHSTTNFIRSFREHVGCTPKQFRKEEIQK